MSDTTSTPSGITFRPFTGGGTLMLGAGVVGLLGLAATAAGMASNPARTMPAYLVAFLYCFGLGLGGVMWLSIFAAGGGQWMTVLRRQVEHIATLVWLGAVFFIPIFVFRKELYLWTHFEHGAQPSDAAKAAASDHFVHLMHEAGTGKAVWLSSNFFLGRALVVFAFLSVLAFLYNSWSRSQDGKPLLPNVRGNTQMLASGALLFIMFSITVCAVDWMMSLEPEWYSAMIGVIYGAGSFLSLWAVLALATAVPTDPTLHGVHTSKHHIHNIGKFIFAMTCFWAYVSYSQLVIIWHANIPEETPWYFARGLAGVSQFTADQAHPDAAAGSWYPVLLFLVVGHFFLPFVALLPQPLKANRGYVAVMAVWILLVHYVDLYFWVFPSMRLLHPDLAAPQPGWQDLAALLGLGGVSVAWVLWRMRGAYAVPVDDPTLPYSLRYVNPL